MRSPAQEEKNAAYIASNAEFQNEFGARKSIVVIAEDFGSDVVAEFQKACSHVHSAA